MIARWVWALAALVGRPSAVGAQPAGSVCDSCESCTAALARDHAFAELRGELDATRRMDATVAAHGDLTPRAQELWTNLNTPMDLGEGFWLTLSPQRVFAAPFALTTETASTRVGIVAQPSDAVAEGEDRAAREAFAARSAEQPLARLQEGVAGVEGVVEVAHDERLARGVVVRQTGEVERRGGAVEGAVLEGHVELEEQRAAVAAHPHLADERVAAFELHHATAEFLRDQGRRLGEGHPRVEREREAITGGARGRRIERRQRRRRRRRTRARGDRGLRDNAQRALTRPLGGGSAMRGELTTLRPIGAFVVDDGVVVRVQTEGRAEVTQDLSGLDLSGRRPAP